METPIAPKDSAFFDLLGLGPDILLLITDYLPPRDIASLRLINSYTNQVTRSSLFRSVNVDLTWSPKKLVLSKLETAGLLQHVQSLDVIGVGEEITHLPSSLVESQGVSHVETTNSILCRYLPKMTALQRIVLRGPDFPLDVIVALSQDKAIKLTAVTWPGARDLPRLLNLRLLSNLHTLHMLDRFSTTAECRAVMNGLRQLLITCHSL